MKTFIGFVATIWVLSLAVSTAAAGTFSLNGFLKNFFVIQQPPSVATRVDGPNQYDVDVNVPALIGNNLRARMNIAADVADWLALDASYNFVPRIQDNDAAGLNELLYSESPSTYRIDDLRPSLVPSHPDADDNFLILQNLDRLLVTLRAPWFDVFVGRQAIAWGSARSVNPTDVIAPYLFTEIDTEDRIGVDAVRVRAPAGRLGEVDVGYVAGKGAEWEESAAYLRAKTYMLDTDVAAIAMAFREHRMLGLDVTRGLGGAGVWCEGAFVDVEDGTDYGRVTTGVDYSFKNATYVFLEYHYNGAGRADPADYARAATRPAFTDGAVYLLGRHYVIPGVTYPATPLFNLGGSLLVNLDDGSFLMAPVGEYNLMENVYLSAGAFVGLGDEPVFPERPERLPDPIDAAYLAPSLLRFESEFGAYTDTYFFSARYYF